MCQHALAQNLSQQNITAIIVGPSYLSLCLDTTDNKREFTRAYEFSHPISSRDLTKMKQIHERIFRAKTATAKISLLHKMTCFYAQSLFQNIQNPLRSLFYF